MNIVGKLLEESGMSQKELSITMGVAQPSISAWVNQKADPKGANAKVIAEIFGVDRDSIVYDTVPPVWNAEYPTGIRKANTPSNADDLSDEDIKKIAQRVLGIAAAPNIDEALLNMLNQLNPAQVQQVKAFVAGLTASRED